MPLSVEVRVSLPQVHAPAPPSLHRVRSGAFPCFLGSTRRSDSLTFLLPGFVSFATAVPSPPVFRSQEGRAPILLEPGLFSGFPNQSHVMETSGPPRFLGNPVWTCPALRPRRDREVRPVQPPDAAFRCFDGVGSRDRFISRLNHAARPLAVYASQPGLPRYHARLASGWWPPLPVRTHTFWVTCEVSVLHLFLPTQASPGAPKLELSGHTPRAPTMTGRQQGDTQEDLKNQVMGSPEHGEQGHRRSHHHPGTCGARPSHG